MKCQISKQLELSPFCVHMFHINSALSGAALCTRYSTDCRFTLFIVEGILCQRRAFIPSLIPDSETKTYLRYFSSSSDSYLCVLRPYARRIRRHV